MSSIMSLDLENMHKMLQVRNKGKDNFIGF